MKIRNGFVSNSSSSSFIVAFPCIPKSAEDVHMIMFGDKPYMFNYYNRSASTHEIANTIFNDIKKNGIANADNYREDPNDEESWWNSDDKMVEAIEKLQAENTNMIIYQFEFGNDSYYDHDDVYYELLLEQCNIFDNLNHRVVSQH